MSVVKYLTSFALKYLKLMKYKKEYKIDYKDYQPEIVRIKRIMKNLKTYIDKGNNGAVWNCLTDLSIYSRFLWETYWDEFGEEE